MIPDQVATWNERVKLMAASINAVGLGLFGFAVLRPLTEDFASVSVLTLWWAMVGVALHAFSHYILSYMRKGSP